MRRVAQTGFACLLAVFVSAAAAAANPLYLNTGTREPYTTPERTGFLDRMVEALFERAGRPAQVVVYDASKRALVNADQGLDDGAAMRVKTLNQTYTNLLRVPEKLIDNDFVAYSLNQDFTTPDFAALGPYTVGHILGWKVFEGRLNHVKAKTTAKGPEQLFGLLRANRVDVVLYERWQGLWRGRRMNLRLKVHEPPLASHEMFIFLHKKHADLVEKAARELRAMKSDGSYGRIFAETLGVLR